MSLHDARFGSATVKIANIRNSSILQKREHRHQIKRDFGRDNIVILIMFALLLSGPNYKITNKRFRTAMKNISLDEFKKAKTIYETELNKHAPHSTTESHIVGEMWS